MWWDTINGKAAFWDIVPHISGGLQSLSDKNKDGAVMTNHLYHGNDTVQGRVKNQPLQTEYLITTVHGH